MPFLTVADQLTIIWAFMHVNTIQLLPLSQTKSSTRRLNGTNIALKERCRNRMNHKISDEVREMNLIKSSKIPVTRELTTRQKTLTVALPLLLWRRPAKCRIATRPCQWRKTTLRGRGRVGAAKTMTNDRSWIEQTQQQHWKQRQIVLHCANNAKKGKNW